MNSRGEPGWLTPRDEYLQLGRDAEERGQGYRELFRGHISDEDLQLIRKAVHYNQPVADSCFREQVESRYGITLGQMRRGRPRIREDA